MTDSQTPDTASPQPVVQGTGQAAMFIVMSLAAAKNATRHVCETLGGLPALERSLNHRHPDAGLSCVIGVASDAWDKLFPGRPRPAHLHPFKEFEGDKHTAPATPGDLLFHIRANRTDACFELAMQLSNLLGDAVVPVDEVHGFRYFDARSMIGFVDGTENPEGDEAAEAALVGDEDPHFAGGSYVIVQKYLHDMSAWNALTVAEQEKVIGRTKYDDREMSDEEKPANSHIALNVIEDENGVEQPILRANLPFGNPSRNEYGTFFIGYARNPAVTEKMLSNMFIGNPPGNYDRLLDFSRAVTGVLFFVPPASLFEELFGED
ncbi:MAG: Dyp-type peroxidase [Lautropia sp.]|nr:Dyp-type peroxidase [Lautropia sp.]